VSRFSLNASRDARIFSANLSRNVRCYRAEPRTFSISFTYASEDLIIHAKMGILAASLLAGIVGYVLLKKSLPPAQPEASGKRLSTC
jgi:hypothetical protein